MKDASAALVVQQMFGNNLIALDSKTRALKPLLAESWTMDLQGATGVWTVKLRKGVPFNEGKGEVTAEDIKFVFAELMKPDSNNPRVGTYKAAIGGDLKNFEIVSPLEFRLTSNKPNVGMMSSFTAAVSAPSIPPKSYYEAVGDAGFNQHPIGSGSFLFKSQSRGAQVVLEAVPKHWRKTADAQTVRIIIAPEDATRIAMLRSGQIDLTSLPPAFKKEVEGARLRLLAAEASANAFVALGGMFPDLPDKNCADCPWVGIGGNAQKVREALTISIDRQAIIDKLMYGEGVPSPAPFIWTPGPFAFNDPGWKAPTFDSKKAKQLLAEAGYANGFKIKFALFNVGFAAGSDVGQLVSGYWSDIGVSVERQPVEWVAFRPKMQKRETGGYAWIIAQTFADEPMDQLSAAFTPASGVAYLHDPKFSKFVTDAGREPDFNKRMAMARELGSYLIEQRLGVPLFSVNSTWALGPQVGAWETIRAYPFTHNVEYIELKR